MTNPNLTHIEVILDRSGSMDLLADEMVKQLNEFVNEQRALPGEATLSLTVFNHEVITVLEDRPVKEILVIGRNDYKPEGLTALYDAVGSRIDSTGERLAKLPEEQRPSKVLFLIITDGLNNRCYRYDQKMVFDRITHQEEVYSWVFTYLGANQDAFVEGDKIAVKSGATLNFAPTMKGVGDAYGKMRHAVRRMRASDAPIKSDEFYTQEEQEEHQRDVDAEQKTPTT